MLKYELKADVTGHLILNGDVEKELGITGLSEHQRQLISAATLHKPVCISDAAWNLLEYKIVRKSTKVHYFNTKPHARLTTAAWATAAGGLRTTGASVPPIRKYEARPPELENYSLVEAFRSFQIKDRASIRGRQPPVGACGAAAAAAQPLFVRAQLTAVMPTQAVAWACTGIERRQATSPRSGTRTRRGTRRASSTCTFCAQCTFATRRS